jgi:hypothetical protein
MTLALDPPVLCRGLVIAAVVRRRLSHLSAGGGLAASGGKDPVAVLLHDGTSLAGIDLAGAPLSRRKLEALVPGAADRLAAVWQAAYGGPAP